MTFIYVRYNKVGLFIVLKESNKDIVIFLIA